MIVLINILFCITYIHFFRNSIKKNATTHYLIASGISVATIAFSIFNFENIVISNILHFFNGGFIALALFAIVMYIGALKKDSKLRKYLLPIRTQLSILASIYLLPHIFTLYQYCITDLMNMNMSGIVTLIIFILFVVLFITSFKYFKLKLKGKKWKTIQRFAYPFYFLTYLHLVSVRASYIALNGISEIPELIIYSIIFLTYFIIRIRKANQEKNNKIYYALQLVLIIFFILIPIKTTIHNLPNNSDVNMNSIEQNKNNNNNNASNNNETIVENKTETSSIINTQSSTNKDIDNISDSQTELISNENLITEETTTKDNAEEIDSTVLDEANTIYNDGVYIDMAQGFRDYIAMEVTIKNDTIVDLQVDYQREDAQFFNRAYSSIVEDILETQSTDVDTVSRATYSSKGIINAVENALEQAKIK